MDYTIQFIDHRGDTVRLTCNSFETAEHVACFLSLTCRDKVSLEDGHFTRQYKDGKEI